MNASAMARGAPSVEPGCGTAGDAVDALSAAGDTRERIAPGAVGGRDAVAPTSNTREGIGGTSGTRGMCGGRDAGTGVAESGCI